MKQHSITIVGAPFNGIGVPPQQENPAQALRDAGLADALKARGTVVCDLGDIEIADFDGIRDNETRVLNLESWKQSSLNLSQSLEKILSKDTLPLVLGGDCGILLGILGSFVQTGTRVGLLMLDGHTDFRDPATSPSGEAADFPLWVITGRGPDVLSHLYGPAPLLVDSGIVVIGYREPDMIDQSGITHYDHTSVAELGVTPVVQQGLRTLEEPGNSIWVHFDVDVIDPEEMPAVHFPEPGGLSMSQCQSALETALGYDRIVGLSVACYHNDVDPELDAAKRLVKLLDQVLS